MPPWHTRLHLGSPSSKPSSTAKSSNSRNPLQHFQANSRDLSDASLHGVPVFSEISSSPPHRQTTRHSRSHSHPFPSLFGSNKPLDEANDEDSDDGMLDLPNDRRGHSSSSSADDMMGSQPNEETSHVTGRCATCNSLVRWPKNLNVFRCSVCLMINDLQPLSSVPQESRSSATHDEGRVTATRLKTTMIGKVPYVSLDRTRRLINECLDQFLVSEHQGHPPNSASSYSPSTIQINGSQHQSQQSFSKAAKTILKTDYASRNSSTISSANKAPTPLSNTLSRINHSATETSLNHPIDLCNSLFRPLESYIIACFTDVACLNSSFLTSRPPTATRAASESTIVNKVEVSKPGEVLEARAPFPELDGKTLLLGDFAENGMWWAGKSPLLEASRPQTAMGESENAHIKVNMKSPRINWSEVDNWYSTIISLQSFSKAKLEQSLASLSGLEEKSVITSQMQLSSKMEERIAESCAHVHRTLFKATENLLRRPGRPLKTPGDCRFLLILLSNPLLSMSEKTQRPRLHDSPFITSALVKPEQAFALKRPPTASRSLPSKNSPGVSSTNAKHSGTIKRILGIISNLSSDCHQHLINWFARFSEQQLRGLVDLVGSFVSYRLSRQNARKRSNSHDPTAGGLIPSISGNGAGSSAQLHAAIGITAKPKSQEKSLGGLLYNDDWQIKAAAKVMALLFSANNNIPLRRAERINTFSQELSRARAGSVGGKRANVHGQLLPTNAFYNTMLDYYDLISDFETWESRQAKFSFCQYPMLLSIWAKIHIMEYDARRQMEVKAREAFFNSIMNRKAISQYLVLKVRRDCLVEDSLRGVSEVVGTGQEEIKKGLRIEFEGEEGLDSGGLRKEWFLLLVREVFDPEHGLFVYDEDSRCCYFNPNTFETSDQFFLVGVLLGLAIYNSTILDVALPPFAFRKLLASAPNYTGPATSSPRPSNVHTLDDLAEYRPAFAQGLRQLLEYEGDVEQTFLLDFIAVLERYGQLQHIPLCPNGENRPVTNANRRDYVDLYVRFLLDTSVSRQYEPFKRGFFTVCGGNALSLFRPEEIELLIRGSDDPLDIATLQAVAIYDGWGKDLNVENESPIKWFWNTFMRANPKDQRKLLSFITASDRIPAMGATSLVIKIACLGDDIDRYPIARTCFNMVGLYRYKSQRQLESKLWRAVVEGEGFGLK